MTRELRSRKVEQSDPHTQDASRMKAHKRVKSVHDESEDASTSDDCRGRGLALLHLPIEVLASVCYPFRLHPTPQFFFFKVKTDGIDLQSS
jgi:hypothetical protein